jgi:hypothetical protein
MTDDQARPEDEVPEETQVQVPVAADAQPAPAVAPVAPVAPAAPGATAPVAAAATGVSDAGRPRGRRRAIGRAGQVVGIIGLVLSFVLAAGALVGTAWVADQINAVASEVDSKIAEGQPKLDTLTEKVSQIKAVVDEVVAAADAATQAVAPDDGLLAGLQDRVNNLASGYANLRNSYGDLRESIAGAVGTLQTLDRIIPGFDVPQGPIDALQGLDARVQELDATISGVLDTTFDGSALRDAAQAVSEKVGRVADGLDTVLGIIDEAGAKLTQARTDIANAASLITSILRFSGVVIALLFVYIAFLHWVLFRTSRAIHRGS